MIKDLLKIYFQNNHSCSEIVQKCRTNFVRREGPTMSGIRKFTKVRENGFIVDAARRILHTSGNIEAIAETIRANYPTSSRHCSRELNILRVCLSRILRNDLRAMHYKVQLFR